MVLLPRYNLLFVHIAKTGGTSVRAALTRLRWRDPYALAMLICSRLSHLTGHRIAGKLPRHARVIAAREMLAQKYFDALFKFAFVRNPWDLQVSSFHHIQRERPQLMAGHEGFASFLRWKLDPERPYQYHLDTSIQAQLDHLVDLDGSMLVDFVGRYERLTDDYARVGALTGIRLPSLPHRRRAPEREADYRRYYDNDTAELVAHHFRRDIEAFGYRFDPE